MGGVVVVGKAQVYGMSQAQNCMLSIKDFQWL